MHGCASNFKAGSVWRDIKAIIRVCIRHTPCVTGPLAIPPISYSILPTSVRFTPSRYLAGTWSLATPYRGRDTALNHQLAVVTIPCGYSFQRWRQERDEQPGRPAHGEIYIALFYRSHHHDRIYMYAFTLRDVVHLYTRPIDVIYTRLIFLVEYDPEVGY